MKNREIAQIFEKIADSIEYKGESQFRQTAYRRAARAMYDLKEDVEDIYRRGDLKKIPNIGSGMADKIQEYLETGHMKRYEEATKDMPDSLMQLMHIPEMGPKTVKLVHKELDITTIDELEKAAREGALEDLPGLGKKKSENILRGIERLKKSSERTLLGIALPLVEDIIGQLRDTVKVDQIIAAGSLRRMKETVGDIDILATGVNGQEIIDAFANLPQVQHVIAKGETKSTIITIEGVQVDLRVVEPDSYGAALQYFTGSKEHNVHLREIARKKDLKVNEYGVFKGEKSIAGKTEEDVYEALDMKWMPPVLRENRGEIEAAMEDNLPRIVQNDDIKGDFHVHSKYSDGKLTIEEMVQAAQEKGYKYLAISDHSESTTIAHGLDEDRLQKQWEEIDKIRENHSDITIFTGTEMDIKPDGSLDWSDDILEKLDLVIASVHAAFKQDRKKMTKRVMAAVENPHVDIIGHLTGRIIGGREGIDVDVDAILKAAAKNGTAIEINAQPDRLDIDDLTCRRAVELGVNLVINTDAHYYSHLDLMRLGVATAQRGWVPKELVINTQSVKEVKKWLEREHAKA